MRTNENKKSASRKLLPAVAMLTTSAIMLSTATYAWFTMSREVSVTGLELTATSPELIEISLGKVEGTSVAAPSNEIDDLALWKNTVAISDEYIKFGKLIPASSVTGSNLFYTNSAIDFGRAVETSGTDPFIAVTETDAIGYYLKGNTSEDALADGYYIDIPVWFRTTKVEDVDLGVNVDITGKGGPLYNATRVAILDSSNVSAGVLTDRLAENYYKEGEAVDKEKTGYYDNVTFAQQVTVNRDKQITNAATATTVATVTKADSSEGGYSDPVKYTIRVWLEGEDKDCWNETAGQSMSIALSFYDKSNTATT